jgi:hypothetical protein
VLGTLWPVEDESTVEFMERFYARLHEGASPAAALQATQVGFNRHARYAHPRHWGGVQADRPVGRLSDRPRSATLDSRLAGWRPGYRPTRQFAPAQTTEPKSCFSTDPEPAGGASLGPLG